MGGQWVDGVMQIDSPAGRYWLHWMQRAVRRGAVSPNTIAFDWQDVITNFRNGLAAMATISRNIYPIDIAPFIEYGAEWRISPEPYSMPGNEAASRYVTNGWPYLVSAQTRHPCEVGLVLRYLADDPQALSNPDADVTEMAARYQSQLNRLARLGR
jgi:hypothetical protein